MHASDSSRFQMKYAPLMQREETQPDKYNSVFTYDIAQTKTEEKDWIFNKKSDKLQVPNTVVDGPASSLSTQIVIWVIQCVSFFLCLITMPFSLFATMKMVRQYERVLVFRLGRFSNLKGPGMVMVMPCIDKWTRVDLRTKAFHIPPTSLPTKDGGIISVGAMVYFRISDPVKMSHRVTDVNKSVRHVAQSCMSALLSRKTYDVILAKRLNLSDDLQVDINVNTLEWGAEVSSVELSDINLLVEPKRPGRPQQQQQSNPFAGMMGDMMGGGDNDELLSGFASLAQQFISNSVQHSSGEAGTSSTAVKARPLGALQPAAAEEVKVEEVIARIRTVISRDLISRVGCVYQFDIWSNTDTASYMLDLKNAPGSLVRIGGVVSGGDVVLACDVKVTLSSKTFSDIISKRTSMLAAYSSGALKLNGSLSDASKLTHLGDLLADK